MLEVNVLGEKVPRWRIVLSLSPKFLWKVQTLWALSLDFEISNPAYLEIVRIFFCGLSSFIKRIVYSYWRHLTQTRAHIFHTMTFWSLFVTIIYYNLPNFCLVIRSLSARACPLTLTNKMCMMPVHTTRLNLRPSILYILLYLFSIIEWLSSFQNVFKNKVKMIM